MAPLTIPSDVERILARLWSAGHGAYVVGGGLRDTLLGRVPLDWDVATSALPDELPALFPGSRSDNRFGTVLVEGVEVTTFRRDNEYRDHRRPDSVTFTESLEEDLARRDFTVNAIAWGRPRDGTGRGSGELALVDPWHGREDLAARVLRAVGDPEARFREDALRLVRAARLAGQLDFTLEPGTRAALEGAAPLVRHVSRERVGQELRKLLAARRPSVGLRLLAETGLLEPLFPELAAQRGIPQNKIAGEDLWDHTLRTVDAAAATGPGDARLVTAALLHDVGKPATLTDGHFPRHEQVGAEMAARFLTHHAIPRREAGPIVELVGEHMFSYEPSWKDAAVRRFLRRIGPGLVDDLLRLRAADNLGSGQPAEAGHLPELRARIQEQLERRAPLSVRDLAIDGHDLQAELGLPPGPELGRILERLLDAVLQDPLRNRREELLELARREATLGKRRTPQERETPRAGLEEAAGAR